MTYLTINVLYKLIALVKPTKFAMIYLSINVLYKLARQMGVTILSSGSSQLDPGCLR